MWIKQIGALERAPDQRFLESELAGETEAERSVISWAACWRKWMGLCGY